MSVNGPDLSGLTGFFDLTGFIVNWKVEWLDYVPPNRLVEPGRW